MVRTCIKMRRDPVNDFVSPVRAERIDEGVTTPALPVGLVGPKAPKVVLVVGEPEIRILQSGTHKSARRVGALVENDRSLSDDQASRPDSSSRGVRVRGSSE